MNGSLNSSIRSPGFEPLESFYSKGLHNGNMQVNMVHTFNMTILNNTFRPTKKNQEQSLKQTNIRSIVKESQLPFTINSSWKIPEKEVETKEEKEEKLKNLMRRPKHKT